MYYFRRIRLNLTQLAILAVLAKNRIGLCICSLLSLHLLLSCRPLRGSYWPCDQVDIKTSQQVEVRTREQNSTEELVNAM